MMDSAMTSRSIYQLRYGRSEELLIVGIAVALAIAAQLSPLALPIAVSGAVFVLAALRFKPLLFVVVFFLPLTPFLNWDFPIRDLTTLIRLSLFAGVLVYKISHQQKLREWLWTGWLTRTLLLYFAVAVASVVFFNPVTLDAQRELMRLASYVCFYYVATDWLQTPRDILAVLKVLMASTIAVAIFGFYQALTGGYSDLYDILYPIQEEIRQIPAWEGRITSFLEHFNGLAGYLNLVIPFCIAFAVRGSDSSLRKISRWCFVVASAALLLTQSRGGLLAYFAMLVVSAWLFGPNRNSTNRKSSNRKSKIRRIAVVLIACLIAGVVAGLFFDRLTEIDDYTAVSRLAIWGGAFATFAHSPIIGVGFGNLRMLMGGLLDLPEGWVGDAHNLYLELLAETGIAGLLVFALFMVVALRTALRGYRTAQSELSGMICFAVFIAMVGVLVHGTVDYLFHTAPQVAAMFFLMLGMLKTQSTHPLEAARHA